MTVTPPGSADRPSAAPAKTFTGVTLTGADAANDTDTETYTAAKAGTATDVVYILSSSVVDDVIAGLNVTFDGAGDRVLTLSGSSSEVGNSHTDTKTVTIS